MNFIKMNFHFKSLFAISLAMGFLLSSCQTETEEEQDAQTETGKIQAVEVVHPEPKSFKAEVLITGTAMPNQSVTIHAMESGYIKSIPVDIGDRVNRGETVAILDNPELYRLQQKLKARFQAKQSNYERLNGINQKTPALTTLQQVEDAKAAFLTSQAELNAINDRIGFLKVTAPFSGIITSRFVDHGALIQSGLTESKPQGIVELQQTNPIRVIIPLPESDAGSVKNGISVNVTFPELAGASYAAKISRTAKSLDAGSKTMQVEIDIDNPDNRILTGMYAKVLLQLNSREDVLSLPLTTRIWYQAEPFILIVENNEVKRLPLRKGLTGKDYFEVLNPGITKETIVIVRGKGLVKPGQIVKPILKGE
jgi:RND family efflux transporter MFP subunit